MKRLRHLSAVAGLLLVSACGSDSEKSSDSEPTTPATAATTTEAVPDTEAPTTTEAAPAELDARALSTW